MFEALVEVDHLEAFLCQNTGSLTTSLSAPAIDGHRAFLVEQFICLGSKRIVHHVDVQAVRDVSLAVFRHRTHIYPLHLLVLDIAVELVDGEVLERILCL